VKRNQNGKKIEGIDKYCNLRKKLRQVLAGGETDGSPLVQRRITYSPQAAVVTRQVTTQSLPKEPGSVK
jgi:hypothetical protein